MDLFGHVKCIKIPLPHRNLFKACILKIPPPPEKQMKEIQKRNDTKREAFLPLHASSLMYLEDVKKIPNYSKFYLDIFFIFSLPATFSNVLILIFLKPRRCFSEFTKMIELWCINVTGD